MGGTGFDFILGGDGNDKIDDGGGDGWNVVFCDAFSVAVGFGFDLNSTTLRAFVAVDPGEPSDLVATLHKYPHRRLGQGNDVYHGADGVDIVLGGGGDDRLYGEGGNDFLIGGDGNDVVDAGWMSFITMAMLPLVVPGTTRIWQRRR